MANTERDRAAAYGKVIARAWRDPSFKAKLIAAPQDTLRQAGVDIPDGVTVKVLENTDMHFHLVVPARPAGALSDEELDQAAGGTGFHASYAPPPF